MKCYVHPDRQAVARCSVCARGVCRACLVVTDGKSYCIRDAEAQLQSEERTFMFHKRGIAISLASLLSVIEGISGLVVGFLLIMLGLLAASVNSPIVEASVSSFMNYFSAVFQYPAWEALLIGFVLMVLGSVDILAGYFLWRRSRWAAMVSIAVSCVTTPLLGIYLVVLALVGVFLYLHIVAMVAKLGSLAYGWRHLRAPHRPVSPASKGRPAPTRL